MLFRSEEDLQHWCASRQVEAGATLTIATLWDLAQRWYSNRLDPDFHGRSVAEAEAIFASLGLDSPFWRNTV